METIAHIYPQITSLENLLIAWQEFAADKKQKSDVRIFAHDLLQNILLLQSDLANKAYKHAGYERFHINDPKSREIHKAVVQDRIVHHAIYRILYPLYDRTFIFDSYSCRLEKGTHRAVLRLDKFVRQISRNYTKPCYALKCDVRKFFDSVDHDILFQIIERKIKDKDTLWLLKEVIESFSKNLRQPTLFDSSSTGFEYERERERESKSACGRKGLPIGNLTSQLFANVYLNELDQFMKHELKRKYYLRYCDDFVILDNDPAELEKLICEISDFLEQKLKLSLHQRKMTIRKLGQGIDFLGYVILPHYSVLRTRTKKRMLKKIELKTKLRDAGKISQKSFNQSIQSYFGVLSHCEGHRIREQIEERISKPQDYNHKIGLFL
ncbi:MAG TPA: reverse transcriptase/maturase family protein [bacterium]|nr:reverse transcriptase/maturase family protein [bacterium]